jgi:hypothetical protein
LRNAEWSQNATNIVPQKDFCAPEFNSHVWFNVGFEEEHRTLKSGTVLPSVGAPSVLAGESAPKRTQHAAS